MSKKATPPTASDDQVRALLQRYRCPVPFHAVRTRFLGNTRVAEHEMHEAVLSCTRARRQMMKALPRTRPVLH
jgi:hypothetical protein